jgi:hypothetical protein
MAISYRSPAWQVTILHSDHGTSLILGLLMIPRASSAGGSCVIARVSSANSGWICSATPITAGPEASTVAGVQPLRGLFEAATLVVGFSAEVSQTSKEMSQLSGLFTSCLTPTSSKRRNKRIENLP